MKSYDIGLDFTQGKGRMIQQNAFKGIRRGKDEVAFCLLLMKSNLFNKVLYYIYAHIL